MLTFRNRRRHVLTGLAALLSCQVVLWLLVGHGKLYRATPSMATEIMSIYQRHAVRYGFAVEGRRPHLNLVLSDDLVRELGPAGVANLSDRLTPWDVTVFTRLSAPPKFLANKSRCDGCQVLSITPKFDTPLLGVAESDTWWGLLGGNGFTNVLVFIFGKWYRVATWQAWVA